MINPNQQLQGQEEQGNWQALTEAAERLYAIDKYAGVCVFLGLANSSSASHQIAAINILPEIVSDFGSDPDVEQTVKALEEKTNHTALSELYQMAFESTLVRPAHSLNQGKYKHAPKSTRHKHRPNRHSSNVVT